LIASCGGTIEGSQDMVADTVTMGDHSNVMPYIRRIIRPTRSVKWSYKVLTLLDSRDITKKMRRAIAEYLRNCPEDRIVVPIGTYRLCWVARYVQKKFKQWGVKKVVVFTGGFIPLTNSDNDSSFNLGCAITAARTLNEGVRVVMNMEIFDPRFVTKDIERAEFIARSLD